MTWWLLAFAVSVCVTTVVRSADVVHGAWERVLDVFHLFLAMSLSWAMLRIGVDQVLKVFQRHPVIGFLSHALTMSVVCSILLILIDAVADHLIFKAEAVVATGVESKPMEPIEPASGQEGSRAPLRHKKRRSLRQAARAHRTREQALRAIIGALGVVIGLSWEMVFESASSTLAEIGTRAGHDIFTARWLRKELFKGVFGVALALGIVLPAWLRFIVPKARMSEREHQAAIEQEAALIQHLFRHDGKWPLCSRACNVLGTSLQDSSASDSS